MSSKKKNRNKAKALLANKKIVSKAVAEKMKLSEQEEALAHITIENYQMMLQYCKLLREAFSTMIKVADEDDSIDPDKTLYDWTAEQVEIINELCAKDVERDNLIEKMVKEFYSEVRIDSTDSDGGTVH